MCKSDLTEAGRKARLCLCLQHYSLDQRKMCHIKNELLMIEIVECKIAILFITISRHNSTPVILGKDKFP